MPQILMSPIIIMIIVVIIKYFLFIKLIRIISPWTNPSWSLWSRYNFPLYFRIEYAFIVVFCELFLILFISIFIVISLFVMDAIHVSFGQAWIWTGGIRQSFALFDILFIQKFGEFGGFMPD